ncbi:MAG: outer membrane lipoprotein carrier protein LolA [Hyphomonadaceae bacterium]|nr:MAG: outer membrane lipoprotein carrier protein LolA [Hyphomonadaceae bacterium]KAF0187142.1 MAG: outer membrane lipoprotein carrier protein LolA [Hyphomonadaceae bacterium]
MRNKIVSLALCSAILTSVTVAIVTGANAQAITGASLQETVLRANTSINALRNVQGRFVQTNPNNTTSGGSFWLSRPGKMRFEYEGSAPLLVVADGTNVIVRDVRLRTTERYALRSTPLYFLLKPSLNLANEVNIIGAERVNGKTIIAMRDRRAEAQGELRVVFSANMELEEWSIKDRQNRVTRVRLVERRTSQSAYARSLFVVPDTGSRNINKKN